MPPETQTSSSDNEAKQMRLAEIELRRAELRKRMEEASKARKAKKGFMTADRKKKLRLLLRKKAAEELKREQERKAEERMWIIEDRCGDPDDLEWASKDDLKDICEDYFQRIIDCESEKWDLEYQIRKKAYEINELNSKVNDLRGKFQKPILKKVSRYDNKFILLQRKAAEFNIKNQLNLKNVKKPDFNLKDNKDGDDRRSFRESVERELLTRSSSLRSLLLDDVVEVEVGKIDEEAEESHDEESLDHLLEEDELCNEEHIEEDSLERGDQDIERCLEEDVEHLGNGIDQDREERLDGELHEDGESRLEDDRLGEERTLEDEPRLDGVQGDVGVEEEDRLGGQSPDLAGEVQPTKPPQSHSPQHTEEDLWHYLKESVSMEHPHTVQDFLNSLIGTLQHVPEEYLQPVIEENIKRANSPCSQTDEEHLISPREGAEDGETPARTDSTLASAEGGEVPRDEDCAALEQRPPQDSTGNLEEDSRDGEGYSILEAAA